MEHPRGPPRFTRIWSEVPNFRPTTRICRRQHEVQRFAKKSVDGQVIPFRFISADATMADALFRPTKTHPDVRRHKMVRFRVDAHNSSTQQLQHKRPHSLRRLLSDAKLKPLSFPKEHRQPAQHNNNHCNNKHNNNHRGHLQRDSLHQLGRSPWTAPAQSNHHQALSPPPRQQPHSSPH